LERSRQIIRLTLARRTEPGESQWNDEQRDQNEHVCLHDERMRSNEKEISHGRVLRQMC